MKRSVWSNWDTRSITASSNGSQFGRVAVGILALDSSVLVAFFMPLNQLAINVATQCLEFLPSSQASVA